MAFENIDEEYESDEESQLKEQSTNSEGTLKIKIIKKMEKSCCLRTHPLKVATTQGGVSQETTSKPVINLKDTNSTSQGIFSQQEMG